MKLLQKLWSKFLTGFGNIKIFKWPMFIVYDPTYFKMTGEKILDVVNLLEPGDIILRGYDMYADGLFIPSEKSYSHGAIYIGNNTIVHAIAEGVSKINVIEFCECDRIAVLRPKKYKKNAVKTAITFTKQNIPYDFMFSYGANSLYCFELVAECYPRLNIKRICKKTFFGLIKKYVYLSESLFNSPDFELVFEYNPKHNIDIG